MTHPEYSELARVLKLAYDQSAVGKGKTRHTNGNVRFEKQQICTIATELGTIAGQAQQVVKKTYEAVHLEDRLGDPISARKEILGAIVYLCGMYLVSEMKDKKLLHTEYDDPRDTNRFGEKAGSA